MSVPWFFHSDLETAGQAVRLIAEEAQHVRGARRLGIGDAIALFNGRGLVAHAKIVSVDSKHGDVIVDVLDVQHMVPIEPTITLASAVPKADRLSTLLNMTAQLSVQQFIPLHCARSVAAGGQRLGPRGERIVREACKQAHCAHAMTIGDPKSVEELLNDLQQRSEMILAADATGRPLFEVPEGNTARSVTVLIGPEGGFTPDELEACRAAGAAFVSLGSTTLRIETACVAAAAAIRIGSRRA